MPKPPAVLIASDHAGFALKAALLQQLPEIPWKDLGPADGARVDYPDFAALLARAISENPPRPGDSAPLGILICGSGIGMCITANKFRNIRAALVNEPVSARLSREHNDANVLCLGSRFLAPEYAAEIVRTWLSTPFTQDPRHQARIDKISQIERKTP